MRNAFFGRGLTYASLSSLPFEAGGSFACLVEVGEVDVVVLRGTRKMIATGARSRALSRRGLLA